LASYHVFVHGFSICLVFQKPFLVKHGHIDYTYRQEHDWSIINTYNNINHVYVHGCSICLKLQKPILVKHSFKNQFWWSINILIIHIDRSVLVNYVQHRYMWYTIFDRTLNKSDDICSYWLIDVWSFVTDSLNSQIWSSYLNKQSEYLFDMIIWLWQN